MINFVQRKRENEQQRAEKKAICWALLQGSLLTPHDRIHAQQLISCCLLSETPVGSFHPPGRGNTWANAGSRGMLVWKKKTTQPYLLIFFFLQRPTVVTHNTHPTESLQNQYSSRIWDKAEPCALIHVSFVLQHLPPVSSRQIISGNNDDDGDEEAAVCLHTQNRCLQQAQQKDNWEEVVPLVRRRRTSGTSAFSWTLVTWIYVHALHSVHNIVDSVSTVHNEDKSALHSREVGAEANTPTPHDMRESIHFKLIGFKKIIKWTQLLAVKKDDVVLLNTKQKR